MNSPVKSVEQLSEELASAQAQVKALVAQHYQFEELVNSVEDYAIFGVDINGRVTDWNKGAERIKGWKAHEIIGQHIRVLYPPEARARLWPEHNLIAAQQLGSYREEGWRQRKDGSHFMARVTISTKHDDQGELWGFTKCTQDLTESLKAEATRREAALALQEIEDLKKVDRLKDQFLGILSHELRTPINAIMGFGSVLEDELVGPLNAGQRKYIRKVLVASDALLALVCDLLDMSHVQAGRLVITRRPVAFAGVLEATLATLAPAAAAKQLAVRTELAADLPLVMADERRLGQILANLVGNALKFTPPSGHVVVRAAVAGDHLRCEVADDGPGITPDDQAKLFKHFSQVDMTSTREAGGIGMGLSIVKALVEAHGGLVGLDSQPGHGSTFWFSLPLQPIGDARTAPTPPEMGPPSPAA